MNTINILHTGVGLIFLIILLAGLLNITLGIYLIQHHKQDRKVIQWLASILILISPLLFLLGFFYESQSINLERPFTFWGAVFILSGVLLNILAKIGDRWGSPE